MTHSLRNIIYLSTIVACLFLDGCHSSPSTPPAPPVFTVLDHHRTGLDFSNTLHPTTHFSVLDYMYYYNGGGVGAGDFNNDGKIDLFFAANQGNNKLYLNTGDLHFRDVTRDAQIPADSSWSTGVSVVDINNDGLLDLYVCKIGSLEGLPAAHNQLLICQGIDSSGIPHYSDSAAAYGLDFQGFSSQAAFFDYDGDGDLDMYLLNHSMHQNGTYGPRLAKLAVFNPLAGDRLYRNEGQGKFTDVTRSSGIYGSVLGYGLGLTISDIDMDGWPDIYTGNDFHENDYLYINQHDGRFVDKMNEEIMHTSRFTMGVDVADANNDGYPEIITMDMLPFDPYILKRSEGEDTWDNFNMKLRYGYNYQYTRNNLQYHRPNGHFSEIAFYAGVAATDWSWAPLWMDFDNDGLKDLFISNGIPRRLNDIDYINFISNQELQQRTGSSPDDKGIDVDKFPQIKLPGKFFHNNGQMQFSDEKDLIEGSRPAFSNGAIYADLDNDGDLDLVVNNIDDPVLVYANTSNDKNDHPAIDIRLKGPDKNINALGARIILFSGNEKRTYENYPVRGFLSSMQIPLHIGLYNTRIDSLLLIWPDNTYQAIPTPTGNKTFEYKKGLPAFDYSRLGNIQAAAAPPVKDLTTSSGLLYLHKENDFHEFDREPLIPHMLSTEGPALAIGDADNNGLDDVFIGSSKWEKSAVFLQERSGRLVRTTQPALEMDSTYEDIDACWTDVDHDGNSDLVIASGGNEFFGKDTILMPRAYLGDGKGHLKKSPGAFPGIYVNASCITPFDFNGDGFIDLFIGGRSVPNNYGEIPRSYLLQNDGKGTFTDVTEKYAPGLSTIGFVTSAQWFDLDKDGQKDLLLSLEWGGIIAYMNTKGAFSKNILTERHGWWNFLLPVDIDNDGDIDLIAGNLGLNSRLTASIRQPVRLYYNDFDDNGKKEQILTYYLDGRQIPFADKDELEKQMPVIKKKFLYAADFAKARLTDLFPEDKLEKADTLTADYFANALLVNNGNARFELRQLPWEAQLAPYRAGAVVDTNDNGLPEILLGGNYYENNIQMGRYDADYGAMLLNKGHDSLQLTTLNGLAIIGQVRHIRKIMLGGKNAFILARNNDSARVIQFTGRTGRPPSR